MHSAAVSHLPTYTTPLVGRVVEREHVAHLLQADETRLVTLVGNSGTGKTRLSLDIASTVADNFADGMYFVALAAVSDAELVLPTIAHTLGVREQSDTPLLGLLAAALETKSLLLILDNVEQVAAAAHDLAKLLAQTSRLKLLVTSQTPLGIPEEILFPVPALGLPMPDDHPSIDELLQYPAVALFVDRLSVVQPRFVLNTDNAVAVVEICRRVEGLPLAIELVAAHSGVLSPRDLLRLLNNHLALRPYMRPGASSRERILGPVLDWCYTRLEPDLQTLFKRLGVFMGGWTLAALDPVCNGVGDLQINLADGMYTLVTKHLVLEETLPDQQRRYVMLDAVRAYVEERLAKSRERLQVEADHAAYYGQLAQAAEEALKGPEQAVWLNRLHEEQPNFRTALMRLLDRGEYEAAAQLGAGLSRFWYLRTHLQEGRRWLSRLLAEATNISLESRAGLLNGAGTLAYTQGAYIEAREYYQAALDIRRELGDLASAARLYNNLGLAVWQLNDLVEAQRLFTASLEVVRALNDQLATANALSNLGVIAFERQAWDEAEQFYTECLQIRQLLGDQSGIAITQHNLGHMFYAQGESERAYALLSESLTISRHLEISWLVATTLLVLGYLELERAAYDKAYQLFRECLLLRQSMGDAEAVSRVIAGLAACAACAEHYLWSAQALSAITRHASSAEDDELYEQIWHDRTMATLQAKLDAATWTQAWAAGQTIELDQLVETLPDQPIT